MSHSSDVAEAAVSVADLASRDVGRAEALILHRYSPTVWHEVAIGMAAVAAQFPSLGLDVDLGAMDGAPMPEPRALAVLAAGIGSHERAFAALNDWCADLIADDLDALSNE